MQHLMFDIDGTLIESYDFDEQCFVQAVLDVTGKTINTNWSDYRYVSDRGILMQFIQQHQMDITIEQLEPQVKAAFIQNIQAHLKQTPAKEVAGAKAFIARLQDDSEAILSLATGGWGESARLKLQSAGFDVEKLVIASSNDHHSRTEIMLSAKAQVANQDDLPITYFGDGEWDKRACDELGVNFVAVGNRVEHHQKIDDFINTELALHFAAKATQISSKTASTFHYRVMTPSDYSQVIDLWSQTEAMLLREADSEQNISRYLIRNEGLSFVALDDEKMIGAVLVGTDGRRGYLQHLAVDKGYRGSGIGKQLVEKATHALKQQGIDKTHLFVANDNLAAQRFYQALGWHSRPEVTMYSYNTSQDDNI